MYVVFMTKEGRMFGKLFRMLRERVPKANICMLNQICAYLVRSGMIKNIDEDVRLEYCTDRDVSVLIINNEIEIEFDDYSGDFGFIVKRNDNRSSVMTVVSLDEQNDFSSLNIYSEIRIKGNGMYVTTFRPKNLFNEDSLKYGAINYYTDDEIEWVEEFASDEINNNFDLVAKNNFMFPFAEKIEFDLFSQTDMIEDKYHGYISNMLLRIDLLYNNIEIMKIKIKKREKK